MYIRCVDAPLTRLPLRSLYSPSRALPRPLIKVIFLEWKGMELMEGCINRIDSYFKNKFKKIYVSLPIHYSNFITNKKFSPIHYCQLHIVLIFFYKEERIYNFLQQHKRVKFFFFLFIYKVTWGNSAEFPQTEYFLSPSVNALV